MANSTYYLKGDIEVLNKYIRRRREEDYFRFGGETVKIAWITDTHIVASVDGKPGEFGAVSELPDNSSVGKRYYYTAGDKLRNYVDKVNEIKPNLAIHTGDAIDREGQDSFDLFMSIWNGIDPQIKKEFIAGNHDFAGGFTYEEMKSDLGLVEENAGSIFNKSYVINEGENFVRIITYDTNINDTGNHVNQTQGKVSSQIVNWVKSELLNSNEDIAILFAHHGIHSNNTYFRQGDAIDFRNMVYDVLDEKPQMTIHNIFGHFHGNALLTTYNTVKGVPSKEFIGFNAPTAVNFGEQSTFQTLNINTLGEIRFESESISYPY